ncbi:uncharacterized protein CTRU02_200971 [Colletotrichum truncatum]|uniref:Uncharacterized protein n=1 Tax=Colletotrichum truncatum TaxID=5467 RepID=A0ACC3ZG50_COLTU|nr:uncharacterized protein CTRU02_00741 [Colletotrichum truncatum]KAF6801992.1 hypothetical protein CTRU02_00741 [Colletotrichum truncatum]
MWLLAVLLLAIVPSVTSQFFSPTQRREVWRIGETRKIGYNTKFTNYSIALWQQALAGGSANIGPVVVEVVNGPKREFDWEVRTNNLDLGASNVFFFWLFEGITTNQGDTKFLSMSSAFFNITDEPAPIETTTSTTAASTTTQAAKSILSETSTSTQSSQTTTAAESGSSETARAGGSTNNGPATSESNGSGSSGGLPVGAQIGIGVGVGVVATTCVVCGILWFRYLKRQQKALTELQERAFTQQPPAYPYEMGAIHRPAAPPPQQQQQQDDNGYFVNKRPVEMY